MMMDKDEITASYRGAKDKREQIKILTELNACSQGQIEAILAEAGYEIPHRMYKKRVRTEAEVAADESRRQKARKKTQKGSEDTMATETEAKTSNAPAVLPDAVQEALVEKLISITEQIDILTKKAEAIREFAHISGEKA